MPVRPRPLVIALLPLCFACTRPTESVEPAPTKPEAIARVEAAPPTPVRPATGERLDALIEAAEISEPWRLEPEQLAAAEAAGFTTDELSDYVEGLTGLCEGDDYLCEPPTTAALALNLLAELGEPRGLEVLVGASLHGVWEAERRVVDALGERARAATQTGSCAPPSADEIAAARADLADFRVLEAERGDKLRPREPSAAELDDLAYFVAAVAGADVRVGQAKETRKPSADAASKDAAREAAEAWAAGVAARDVTAAYAAGTRFLRALGWPGELQVSADPQINWGGASHSYVMRDMALLAELFGDYEDAVALWTRANPSGGMCGTGASSNWKEQVKGRIRAVEALGDCRPVVAERLLEIDAHDWWSFGGDAPDYSRREGFDYGVGRLVAAGFEVERLYRGALLTRNRDAPPAELAARIVGRDRDLVRARLVARGTEAWDARVWALEGFADTLGRAAVEPLFELIAGGDARVRERAIRTLGNLGRRHGAGPCDPDDQSVSGRGSSGWYRVVHPFAYNCATRLDDGEVAKLGRRLRPYLDDPDPQVRVTTAEALVELAALGELASVRQQIAREAKQAAADEYSDSVWVQSSLGLALEQLEELEQPTRD